MKNKYNIGRKFTIIALTFGVGLFLYPFVIFAGLIIDISLSSPKFDWLFGNSHIGQSPPFFIFNYTNLFLQLGLTIIDFCISYIIVKYIISLLEKRK